MVEIDFTAHQMPKQHWMVGAKPQAHPGAQQAPHGGVGACQAEVDCAPGGGWATRWSRKGAAIVTWMSLWLNPLHFGEAHNLCVMHSTLCGWILLSCETLICRVEFES